MTDRILTRLESLGLSLPPAAPSRAMFLPFRVSNNWVFLAGQVSEWNGTVKYAGKVGCALDVAAGQKAAQMCMLNLLFNLRAACDGDFGRVRQCIRVGGFVNCEGDFPDAPKVIDGASQLLIDLFGDAGRHARTTVGVAALPANAAVEVDAIFEIG